jgi:5-methylthioadenosine/S-adenosylhomocysteine deaminase
MCTTHTPRHNARGATGCAVAHTHQPQPLPCTAIEKTTTWLCYNLTMSSTEIAHIDTLLINGYVVTMDSTYTAWRTGAVAIKDDHIIAVGDSAELQARYTATHVIDCAGCAILPGLINTHTHVPMTLLRGLADDLRLDVWLYGYMLPVERKFVTPTFVRLGAKLAAAEMIRSGVTCVNDMYYFEDDIAETLADAGMRALCGQSIMQFPTPDSASPDESLAYVEKFISRWKNHPLIVPVIAPHAPYTCSGELLQTCAEIATRHDVPLHIHIDETKFEADDAKRLRGMSSVSWIKKNGVLEAKTICAHCVWIDRNDMRVLKNAGASISHNPAANLKLASGIADATGMLEIGVKVGVGTDGPASNNDLDHFEEMRLVSLLAKGSTRDPLAIPAKTALRMATLGGAEALHIENLTGSLEPGKRADVIVLDLAQLHSTPQFSTASADPNAIYTQIVYSSKAADVRDVYVNGRCLMRERALLTLDETAIRTESDTTAREIGAFFAEREGDVLSKLAAIGGVQQQESFEVQVKARITDAEPIRKIIEGSDAFNIIRAVHYKQFDTYFFFNNEPSRLRYREDETIAANGTVTGTRYRLTLVSGQTEQEFPHSILLSRVRYFSAADRSLRFYREYFRPDHEVEVQKDRQRWEVFYDDEALFINIDQMVKPAQDGYFLEIKSRTWSPKDAERKAEAIAALLALFGVSDDAVLRQEYVEIAEDGA